MSASVGTAKTVGELIEILQRYPADFPVRSRSLSHEWPVEVEKHERCLTIDMGGLG